MKIKQFVHAKKEEYLPEPTFSLHPLDMTKYGYVLLGEIEVEIPFPMPTHEEFNAGKVKELRAEQGTLTARMNAIESRIQELTCIEHKQGVAE